MFSKKNISKYLFTWLNSWPLSWWIWPADQTWNVFTWNIVVISFVQKWALTSNTSTYHSHIVHYSFKEVWFCKMMFLPTAGEVRQVKIWQFHKCKYCYPHKKSSWCPPFLPMVRLFRALIVLRCWGWWVGTRLAGSGAVGSGVSVFLNRMCCLGTGGSASLLKRVPFPHRHHLIPINHCIAVTICNGPQVSFAVYTLAASWRPSG